MALRGTHRGTKTQGEPGLRSVESEQRVGSAYVAPRGAGATERMEKKSKGLHRERNTDTGPHVLHTRSQSHYLGLPVLLPQTHTKRYSMCLNANMYSRHLVTTCKQMDLLCTESQHKI